MEAQAITRPTVVVLIGDSAITRDASGEILEAETVDGQPAWEDATVCDQRGAGGGPGFELLRDALDAAEDNARQVGLDIVRVG